jgi:hypothetical protein
LRGRAFRPCINAKNNFVKNIYCISFGRKHTVRNAAVWFCFFAGAAFGMAQDISPSTNAVPVLLVNRQPVSAEEFVWFMQQERAGVFQLVKAKFNLDHGTNFWDRELSGGTPRALLRQRTVERIVHEKVQQLLFRELGLVGDIRYATFVKNLEKLNRERESAAQQGQVVYGPVRYTQLQYYVHWMAGLRLCATEQLAQSRWDVSDGQVRDFYERNKEQFRRAEIAATPTRETDSETNASPTPGASQPILSFEEARPRARSQYLDYLYNQLVSDRVKQADVRLNQAMVDALIQ